MAKFYCHDHQGKAAAYIEALTSIGGHIRTSEPREADFALLDHDLGVKRLLIKTFERKPIFLYPHTPRPWIQYDGMYPPNKLVTAQFVVGEGALQVMRAYEFEQMCDRYIYAVGWSLCPIQNFQPVENPKKILFAPIHVNGNGYLSVREKRTNRRAYMRLLNLARKQGLELTVRYLYTIEGNGIYEDAGVKYVRGEADQSFKDIDAADVIVSHQTMAYIAIARGKPTLMMEENKPPMSGNTLGAIKVVKSWDKYKDLLMFPHDILAKEDPIELIKDAARSDEKIREWKNLFIGKPFNGQLFVSLVGQYL